MEGQEAEAAAGVLVRRRLLRKNPGRERGTGRFRAVVRVSFIATALPCQVELSGLEVGVWRRDLSV